MSKPGRKCPAHTYTETEMSTAADAVPTSEKPLTEVERVVDTFIAPSKTFTDIRRNASWWVPFVIVSLVWVALVWVVDKQIGMETVTENQLRLSPKQEARMENMPPDQRASAMALGESEPDHLLRISGNFPDF